MIESTAPTTEEYPLTQLMGVAKVNAVILIVAETCPRKGAGVNSRKRFTVVWAVTLVLGLGVVLSTSRVFAVEEWRQFRGPYGDGVSQAVQVPEQWAADKNVLWKVKIPGVGWSQPIVTRGKVIVTTAVADDQPRPKVGEGGPGFSFFSGEGLSRLTSGGKPPDSEYLWQIHCYDLATGNEDWARVVLQGKPPIATHRSNSYASETPVSDGERIYMFIAMRGVYCFNLAGEPVWKLDLDVAPMLYGWGTGSSPVIDKERLYVICDNEKESFLLALDKKTGDERWRVKRDELSNWSTPYIWNNKHRTELVTSGGKKMRSYDPESGKLLWELPGGGRCSTTPVGNQDLLVVGSVSRSTGSRGDLVAVRAGADGELKGENAAEYIAWTQKRSAPEIASPILADGKLFTMQQQGGIVRCFDATTGKILYRERVPGAAGFTASPVAIAGRLYCLDERGQTAILETGKTLEVVATNKLPGMFWSSPAIVDGRLLLRSDEQLFCIGSPK